MTTISINGVTLSANASANGFPLRRNGRSDPSHAGDYAERAEGRLRRSERVFVRAGKRSFIAGM